MRSALATLIIALLAGCGRPSCAPCHELVACCQATRLGSTDCQDEVAATELCEAAGDDTVANGWRSSCSRKLDVRLRSEASSGLSSCQMAAESLRSSDD